MSTPHVRKGSFTRSCRTCGWKRTYETAARADYSKRRHSCAKQQRLDAAQQRGEAREALVDRTPKPCLHKVANHQHGTRACYVLDRCRCLPCSQANSAAETERERQKAYGRYDKYVDAEVVRSHIVKLGGQGMGLKRVARAAGVSNGSLSKIMFGVYAPLTGPSRGRYGAGDLVRGPSKRVLRTTADKVLAVQLDLADGAPVDATGTTRRIRALVALGWSQSKLATRLGVQRSNFHLARSTRSTVRLSTAQAVVALYDELSMVIPPNDTHRDRQSVSRARRYAKARGWLPPLALDDDRLDDPMYKPESLLPDVAEGDASEFDEVAIYRRTHGGRKVRLTKAEAAELVRRWADSGRALNECERITGLQPYRYIDRREAS